MMKKRIKNKIFKYLIFAGLLFVIVSALYTNFAKREMIEISNVTWTSEKNKFEVSFNARNTKNKAVTADIAINISAHRETRHGTLVDELGNKLITIDLEPMASEKIQQTIPTRDPTPPYIFKIARVIVQVRNVVFSEVNDK